MKILVFDKYLGYNVGGAQQSLRALLKGLNLPNVNFEYIGCEVVKSFNSGRNTTDELMVDKFKIFEIPRFPYLEYFLNRNRIIKAIQTHQADVLITQGLWGAVAVNAFRGKSLYFIRDEYQLSRIPFYQQGIKKILKFVYLLVQLPFMLVLFHDNKKAILKSTTVANSQYLQTELKKKFHKDVLLVRSPINIEHYTKEELKKYNQFDYITCVGSEYMKGSDIVKKIAAQMPANKFMIVGREFKQLIVDGNISYHPWVKEVRDILNTTKILLVPSICQESFPRVAIEAMNRGIPVLGSSNGGIPEILPKELIIKNLWDIDSWKEIIFKIETNYEQFSDNAYELSLNFDPTIEILKFQNILLSLENN